MDKKKTTLKEKIHNEIFKDIIQGVYKPGHIISEISLAEKYRVSKAPVREALVELCNEGVLRSIPRYGYELVPLTESDIKNIREFRYIIESSCLRENWQCFTDERIRQLETIAAFIPESTKFDDITKLWANNTEFHLTMMSFCGNRYIYNELAKAMNVLTRAFAQMYWDEWSGAMFGADENLEHKELLVHIKANDPDAALACLKCDIWGDR